MTELDLLDFYSPTAGFDQPLAVVKACHERVRRMVEMLVPLREHLDEHGTDRRAIVSAGAIRQYLEEAWPRHVQDEEIDLLPRISARLRNCNDDGPYEDLAETIAAVSEQHRAFEPLFQRVLPLLRAVETGAAQRLDEPAVQAFVELFRIHMALEEDILGPAYARFLTPEDLRQIGRAMAARRGVAWPAADANPA